MAMESGAAPSTPTWPPAPRAAAACVHIPRMSATQFMGRLPPNPREACLRREAGRSQTILYGRIHPISGELPKGTSKLLPLPQDNRRLTAGIVFSGNRAEHALRHARGKAPLGGAPIMAVACASGRCPTGTWKVVLYAFARVPTSVRGLRRMAGADPLAPSRAGRR